MVAYGGFPDSPFNGGRNNFLLDRMRLYGRLWIGLTRGELSRAVKSFEATVEQLNAAGISFRLAFTNMFVREDELTEKNLLPVECVAAIGRRYGMRNGIIVNNALLERHVRSTYGDALVYVSSCTKYVSPDKILTPQETLRMYHEDCRRYDYVCLTPQDSRRERVLTAAAADCRAKIIAIANSYCSNACNSYDHYEYMSRENKQSLLGPGIIDARILFGTIAFACRHLGTCSAYKQVIRLCDVNALMRLQLQSGIVNFKLGRGFGDKRIGIVVKTILDWEKTRENTNAGAASKDCA